jgi:hypothetical protein
MNKPSIPSKSKSRFKQGKFVPENPLKYQGTFPIVYRSSWERRFMEWLDRKPSVLFWGSESLVIPYISPVDGNQHRYFIDFVAVMRTKSGEQRTYAIEVKPKKEMLPPKKNKNVMRQINETKTYLVNQAKWEAAKSICEARGVSFIVLNEDDLKI